MTFSNSKSSIQHMLLSVKTLENPQWQCNVKESSTRIPQEWMHSQTYNLYRTLKSRRHIIDSQGGSWGSYTLQQYNCFLATRSFTKQQYTLYVVLSKHLSFFQSRIHMQKRMCAAGWGFTSALTYVPISRTGNALDLPLCSVPPL